VSARIVSWFRGLGLRAAVMGSNYELLLGLCVRVRVGVKV